jgi:hypothetical protein
MLYDIKDVNQNAWVGDNMGPMHEVVMGHLRDGHGLPMRPSWTYSTRESRQTR